MDIGEVQQLIDQRVRFRWKTDSGRPYDLSGTVSQIISEGPSKGLVHLGDVTSITGALCEFNYCVPPSDILRGDHDLPTREEALRKYREALGRPCDCPTEHHQLVGTHDSWLAQRGPLVRYEVHEKWRCQHCGHAWGAYAGVREEGY